MEPPLIVIFGAAVRADGRPSAALQRRIAYGYDAAVAWPDAPVLCSGGVGRAGPSEASIMVEALRDRGLGADRLIADDASMDTLQSVVAAVRMVRDQGRSQVVAVSDDYHLPRIRLMFAVLGVRTLAGPRAAGWPRGPWSHRLRMSLREVAAIPYDVSIVAVRRRALLS